ncbi:hypothetical protein C8J36_103617 [Rhizobium sp. PP-F2F-G48]|uniref:hypothetical protein n=1 Tax=Rhizobium sp. PP-F2F-G48 TaxID=2135651 RepID=UPI0010E2F2E3|nr:hypothetical protein [Rhizobium sp. PP-F2F-G48]TCM56242.1 hypothetical protein C8J36_103617 [Rhizobium sp. PP-F2F-G48]
MENYLWLFATAGGAAILSLALAFGLSSQRKLSRAEKERQAERVEDLYDKR